MLFVWLTIGRLARRLFRFLLVAILVLLAGLAVRRFGTGFAGGIAVGFALGILAAFGGLMFLARRMRSRIADHLQPAAPPTTPVWDYVMDLRTLDGQVLDASTFRGRMLFLNFWATWCPPCVAEMPSIERLASRLADTDVAFACVTREPAEKVRSFLAKKPLNVPIYLIGGESPPVFESLSIPATFVVSPGGAVSLRHVGAARWDSEEMVSYLRAAAPRS